MSSVSATELSTPPLRSTAILSTRPPFDAGGSQCRSRSGVGTNDEAETFSRSSDAEAAVAAEDVAATAAAAEGARSASATGGAA